jgi:hypothetical protein
MEMLPDRQTTSAKNAKKSRGFKIQAESPTVAAFESLLKRRQELTMQAHQAQDELDAFKVQLAHMEANAEAAWDQAIDMNAVIREHLNDLRDKGVDDKTIYKLIDRYNAL